MDPARSGDYSRGHRARKLGSGPHQLIERNLRNKLVTAPSPSKRSKQIRIVDELADEISRSMLGQRKK